MLSVDLLQSALTAANSECGDGPASQQLHRDRSKHWIACLAARLAGEPRPDNVRVFSKHFDGNRFDFGLNELLYDICIVETATCKAAVADRELRYVTRALWQVESEFARDSFEAVKDFNKLVIGSAVNKLFVGPCLGADRAERYRATLLPVARCCGDANVYLAHVPHPDSWRIGPGEISLWQLRGAEWAQV